MPDVTTEKCKSLYGSGDAYILFDARKDLVENWETENLSLINAVAGDIGTAMEQFNREADNLNQQIDINIFIPKFATSEINDSTDPRTWDYGGSDGYGEFGETGEIIKILEDLKQVIEELDLSALEANLINSINNLKSTLEPTNFFGPNYDNIRNAFLERYQIEKCYLESQIEEGVVRDSDLTINLDLREIKQRLADL